MSYYFIANIKIKDPEEYQVNIQNAGEVFRKYNGKYLAIDNDPLVLEGSWEYSRHVIIEFNSKEDFKAWYYSNEYQKIRKFRLNAAACDTVLVEGL